MFFCPFKTTKSRKSSVSSLARHPSSNSRSNINGISNKSNQTNNDNNNNSRYDQNQNQLRHGSNSSSNNNINGSTNTGSLTKSLQEINRLSSPPVVTSGHHHQQPGSSLAGTPYRYVLTEFKAEAEDEIDVAPGDVVLHEFNDDTTNGVIWSHVLCLKTNRRGFVPFQLLSTDLKQMAQCKKKLPRSPMDLVEMHPSNHRINQHNHPIRTGLNHHQAHHCVDLMHPNSPRLDLFSPHNHSHDHHHHHHNRQHALTDHHFTHDHKTHIYQNGNVPFIPPGHPYLSNCDDPLSSFNQRDTNSRGDRSKFFVSQSLHDSSEKQSLQKFPDLRHFASPAYSNLRTPDSHFQDNRYELSWQPFHKENHGVYVVICDFVGLEENDLSVGRCEYVFVLNKDDEDWYWVRKEFDQAEGFVPSKFICDLQKVKAILNKANSTLTLKSSNDHHYINNGPDMLSLATERNSSVFQPN